MSLKCRLYKFIRPIPHHLKYIEDDLKNNLYYKIKKAKTFDKELKLINSADGFHQWYLNEFKINLSLYPTILIIFKYRLTNLFHLCSKYLPQVLIEFWNGKIYYDENKYVKNGDYTLLCFVKICCIYWGDIENTRYFCDTPYEILKIATEHNSLEIIKHIIDEKVWNMSQKTNTIGIACINNSFLVLKFLIKKWKNDWINGRDFFIHKVCSYGYLKILKFLIAELNIHESIIKRGLDIAVVYGKWKIFKYLVVEKGVIIDENSISYLNIIPSNKINKYLMKQKKGIKQNYLEENLSPVISD